MAPGEGRVVAYDYGCGAHSDAVIDLQDQPSTEHAFDTTGYDVLELAGVNVEPTGADDEVEDTDTTPDEELADVAQAVEELQD